MSEPTTPDRPTSAGMYDYYLGGTSHTPLDRAAAEQIVQLLPGIADGALANRGFLQRAVARMAGEWGVRQFIDIGSGLPTQRNTHDVVAETIGDGRVIYVDNDPAVVERSQQLLAGATGATAVQGDFRQPGAVLDHPTVRDVLDLTEPVGLLLIAVLHFVPDDDDPWGLVARYLGALPSGSYLALSHSSMADRISDEARQVGTQVYAATPNPPTDRSRTEIERFFAGLEIVPAYDGGEPGVAYVGLWGADDPATADSDGSRLGYAAVARKP